LASGSVTATLNKYMGICAVYMHREGIHLFKKPKIHLIFSYPYHKPNIWLLLHLRKASSRNWTKDDQLRECTPL